LAIELITDYWAVLSGSLRHSKKTDDACRKKPYRGKSLVYKVAEIATLPYDLLEMVACCIDSGEDLVNWLTACESVGNLGYLQLILRLPLIVGHSNVKLKQALAVKVSLSEDDCEVAKYRLCTRTFRLGLTVLQCSHL
jgi:hypothetical protein